MAFGKQTQPIIRRFEPMTEGQLNAALAVSESHPFYRAIVQLLEDAIQENAAKSASYAREDKPFASAGHIVAWEEFSGLLLDIEQRRSKNAD